MHTGWKSGGGWYLKFLAKSLEGAKNQKNVQKLKFSSEFNKLNFI